MGRPGCVADGAGCVSIGCDVDSTIITTISGIVVDQAATTEETMQQSKQFLSYVVLQED